MSDNFDKVALLIMVTGENNNKYYNMYLTGDVIQVEYGRVGVTKQTQTYPSSKWDSLYKSKIRKGYRDQTELFAVVKTAQQFADISDGSIRAFVDKLVALANGSVQRNYLVGADKVTQAQIDEAQQVLNILAGLTSVNPDKVNEHLLKLYSIIPRRMSKVQEHLLDPYGSSTGETKRFSGLIAEEQDNLDVMRGQVSVITQQQDDSASSKTLLDAMGFKFKPCTTTEEDRIHKMLASELRSMFRRAFKVEHSLTGPRFDTWMKKKSGEHAKKRLLWHGSRSENWWSILSTGLVLRPTNAVRTGSMFGNGLYFADRAKKAIGYTSLSGSYWARGNASSGFLGVFEIHYGVPYRVQTSQGHLNESCLKGIGDYDCVFAEKGRSLYNNEFIVYNEAQATIRYIVELGR